jgi:hypothetical protein
LPGTFFSITKASYFHSPRITRINTNDLYPSPAPATYFHLSEIVALCSHQTRGRERAPSFSFHPYLSFFRNCAISCSTFSAQLK